MRLSVIVLLSVLANTALAADVVRLLPKRMSVSANTIEGSGSWVAVGHKGDRLLPMPLINASEFTCRKELGSCTEAVAALFTSTDDPRMTGSNLHSILEEYVVTSWTDTKIVAVSKGPAADVTLEIDFGARTARRRYQQTRASTRNPPTPPLVAEWTLR